MTDIKVDEKRMVAFEAAYADGLRRAVEERPDEYLWAGEDAVGKVVAKMMTAVRTDSHNHGSRGFALACRTLGIKHTRAAIRAYLAGQTSRPRERTFTNGQRAVLGGIDTDQTFTMALWMEFMGHQGGTIHQALRDFRALPAGRREAFRAILRARWADLTDDYLAKDFVEDDA